MIMFAFKFAVSGLVLFLYLLIFLGAMGVDFF